MAEAVYDKAHAKRSPSGAKHRKLCPGSVVLEAGREDRASKYAAEGTVAHNVMELCITEDRDAEAYVGRVFSADGFEFEVDMAMATHVNEFLAYVRSYVDPAAGDTLLVEQQVPIGLITGEAGATGTADVIGITDGGTHLFVGDLKYGKGMVYASHPVDAGDPCGPREPNEQLGHYGLGALEEYGLLYPIERVTLFIGQPRKEHFDPFELTVVELEAFGKKLKKIELTCDSAEADAKAAFFAERYLHPSEDACRFCKAKTVCPALLGEVDEFQAGAAALADDFADLTTDCTSDIPGVSLHMEERASTLGDLFARIPLIEQFCKAVRAEAEAEAFAGRGEAVGLKLVEGKRGNRAWGDPVVAEQAMRSARLKVDDMFDQKLRSPPAMEKVLKDRPRVWSKLEALIVQAEGQPSVAKLSDPRPAIDLSADLDAFADLADDGGDLI